MPTKLTTEILTAAIDGFEIQKARIDAQIAEIRQLLEGGPAPVVAVSESAAAPASSKRRKMSKAGRAAIAEAQRKRWADSKKPAAEAPKPKRKLSAAGRKAIIAATKKRWAAKRAEAAKQAAEQA